MDEHHIVATGYDQRMTVWRLEENSANTGTELALVTGASIDVGDINCLAHCNMGNGKHTVVAGGAGQLSRRRGQGGRAAGRDGAVETPGEEDRQAGALREAWAG